MKNMVRYGIATVLLLYSVNAFAQIRVTEIGYNGVMYEGAAKWVELHNTGNAEADVSLLLLCNFPEYPEIRGLTSLGGGSLTIPADGYLVVSWPQLGDSHAEVGLYTAGTFNFEDESRMLDYMEYGEAGHTREPIAVAAGLWETGVFVPAAESGKSLQLIVDPISGEEEWEDRDPTPNAPNLTATAIDDFDDLPGDFRLFANFPNPFNPSTSISYELSHSGEVALGVYDMLGKKVVDLHRGVQAAGSYSTSWDGRDASGNGVASGLYLYRLTVDGRNGQSRVMTLLK